MIECDDKVIARDAQNVVLRSEERGYAQTGFFYRCLLKGISQDIDDLGLPYEPIRMALSTRVQVANLPALLLPVIAQEYIRVRISHVPEPRRVFVQLENNAHTIIEVSARLKELARKRHEPLCNPESGTIVAARYPDDRCYYRASVFSKIGFDSVIVVYIDYGDMKSIDVSDAFVLRDRELLSIPPQAVQLVIRGVTKNSRLTADQISGLLSDQTIGAQILKVSVNGESFIANLFVKDKNNKCVNLTEIILGERPAPALPPPQPIPVESFIDTVGNIMDDKPSCYDGRWNFSSFARNPNFAENSGLCEGRRAGFHGRNEEFEGSDILNSGSSTRKDCNRNNYKGYDNACYNCGNSGHFTRECSERRRSNFNGYRSGVIGSERFRNSVSNIPRSGNNKRGVRSDGDFGDPLRQFPDNSRHFLDRAIMPSNSDKISSIAAEKGSGKLGIWEAKVQKEEAQSRVTKSSNFDLGTNITTENWDVNCGGWEINSDWKQSEAEGSEQNSSKLTTISTTINLPKHTDEIQKDEEGRSPSKTTEILTVNAFGVPLSRFVNVSETAQENKQLSVEEETTQTYADLSNSIFRIESPSLEEIEFGEVVDGMRSDGSVESDPLSFFVQLERDESTIVHLSLPNLPADLSKLSSFEMFQACIGPCMGDFYRAEIVGRGDNEKYRILFVDYGNIEDLDTSELYVLDKSLPPPFYESRKMAFHCRLHDVVPVTTDHVFDLEARRVFSELTVGKLCIRFIHQSVKGIYDVTLQLYDGRFISDILIARGFAVRFNWGIGPPLPLYEQSMLLRSDEYDHVEFIFTVQLADSLELLERLDDVNVGNMKVLEAPQVGNVVIAYFEGSPYRAEIIGIENDSDQITYRLRYVDYGNESIKKKEELFVLDRDQQPDEVVYTHRQGARCRIEGIRPLLGGECWSEKAQECIDCALASCSPFEAIAGSPNMDGIYPIKVMVTKKNLNEDNSLENDVSDDMGKIDLANWLVMKDFAKVEHCWSEFPMLNLLLDGKREHEMIITEVDGQIIRAQPCAFASQYTAMKKALANIEIIPAEMGSLTGLIIVNNEKKRATVLQSSNDTASTKYLLVDEGISVELPTKLFCTTALDDLDGFLVRTCHQLSVQLSFPEPLLDKESKEIILSRTRDGSVKVVLFECNKDGSYLITDISFADGTSLKERCIVAKAEVQLIQNEQKLGCDDSSQQDELSVSSKPLTSNEMEEKSSSNLLDYDGFTKFKVDNDEKDSDDSDDSIYTDDELEIKSKEVKKDPNSSDTEYGIVTSESESEVGGKSMKDRQVAPGISKNQSDMKRKKLKEVDDRQQL